LWIKKQLKHEYGQVVAERNALQLQLTASDKVDVVRQLQERIAILERARVEDSPSNIDLSDPDAVVKRIQQLSTQNELLQKQLAEARQIGDKPGLLIGKPNTAETHYVISMRDAEEMTKRIKKLQSELWNLEIKHQQLQEAHSKCGLVPATLDLSSDEVAALKDAIKKERDVNMLLQARYKDLNDAVTALKEQVVAALAKDPDSKLLQTVLAVTKKALPPPASSAGSSDSPSSGKAQARAKHDDEPGALTPPAASGPARSSTGKDPVAKVSRDKKEDKEEEKKRDRKSRVIKAGQM